MGTFNELETLKDELNIAKLEQADRMLCKAFSAYVHGAVTEVLSGKARITIDEIGQAQEGIREVIKKLKGEKDGL